jgi:hypothetical protein
LEVKERRLIMNKLIVFAVIVCMALLYVGAQEAPEPVEPVETVITQPVDPPVTRLKVKLIDDLSDQYIKLENCVVQLLGELHIAEDSFNYSNTFIEGDIYEITIHIRVKK